MAEHESGITTGELSRAVELIRKDIAGIQTSTPSKESVDNLKQRVTDLENWQTWALRIGVPGLCAAALNFINTLSSNVGM